MFALIWTVFNWNSPWNILEPLFLIFFFIRFSFCWKKERNCYVDSMCIWCTAVWRVTNWFFFMIFFFFWIIDVHRHCCVWIEWWRATAWVIMLNVIELIKNFVYPEYGTTWYLFGVAVYVAPFFFWIAVFI